jgi:hypothetical protein
VSVLPEQLGFLRGVRKQKLKFSRRERRHFDVFPGEIIEFRLDTLVGGVMDLSGASAVSVPSDAAGRAVEVSIRKAGYRDRVRPIPPPVVVRD